MRLRFSVGTQRPTGSYLVGSISEHNVARTIIEFGSLFDEFDPEYVPEDVSAASTFGAVRAEAAAQEALNTEFSAGEHKSDRAKKYASIAPNFHEERAELHTNEGMTLAVIPTDGSIEKATVQLEAEKLYQKAVTSRQSAMIYHNRQVKDAALRAGRAVRADDIVAGKVADIETDEAAPLRNKMVLICDAVAGGSTLPDACAMAAVKVTQLDVRKWMQKHGEFAIMYSEAIERRTLGEVEKLLEIADDTSKDYRVKTDSRGKASKVVDLEHIARSKLRLDTRKWIAEKLLPKQYGNRSDLVVSGSVDVKHTVTFQVGAVPAGYFYDSNGILIRDDEAATETNYTELAYQDTTHATPALTAAAYDDFVDKPLPASI